VGAGLRLGFLTLGARGRVAAFQDESPTRAVAAWQLWTLDAELGMRVPLGRVEPHLAVAGGYTTIGGFDDAVSGLSAGLNVNGVDARAEGGVDVWVTRTLSLGASASGELLALSRPGVPVRDVIALQSAGTVNDAKARVLMVDGSSVGTAVALTGNVGLHF
jgi:hypothetical protein